MTTKREPDPTPKPGDTMLVDGVRYRVVSTASGGDLTQEELAEMERADREELESIRAERAKKP